MAFEDITQPLNPGQCHLETLSIFPSCPLSFKEEFLQSVAFGGMPNPSITPSVIDRTRDMLHLSNLSFGFDNTDRLRFFRSMTIEGITHTTLMSTWISRHYTTFHSVAFRRLSHPSVPSSDSDRHDSFRIRSVNEIRSCVPSLGLI